ncbi:MAG: serine/threonine-protein kinase [Acidobacteriota bacterium]
MSAATKDHPTVDRAQAGPDVTQQGPGQPVRAAVQHPKRVGKYEIEEFLGGGMSHVYRATDTVLGRRVALKLLTAEAVAKPEAHTKFLQEARLASNVHHENIVTIFDFGEDAGRPFLVMEFVEGESLRSAIENGRAGDTAERIRIARQAARALEYVHSRKVIHRDLKPENIHIDRTGKVRLMDFGIASLTGEGTKEGAAAGTPYYMAPEQVLGRPLTAQADIYSFGVVLYELFTGKKPFQADTVEKIFEQILYQPVDLDLLTQSNAPQLVADVIARCTTKKLMERPDSMGPVVEMLQKASAENPARKRHAPPATPGGLSPSSQRSESAIRLAMPPPPDPSNPEAQEKLNTATSPEADTPGSENSLKSLALTAGGAGVVAFLIYVVVRLTGVN